MKALRTLFILVFVLVFAVSALPLVTFVIRLATRLENLSYLFLPDVMTSLWHSVRISLISLFGCLVLSVPLAWLLIRTNLPLRIPFRRILLFPYMLPPFLFAIAWVTLAVPEVGLLNRTRLGSWVNIYSELGLVLVLSCAYLSITLSSLCNALETMDPSLEEAARVCGASPTTTLCRITIPCMLPSICGASLLYLLAVLSAFGIPAIIGGPARIHVLTMKIYTYSKMGGIEGADQAFAVSLWLLFSTLAFLMVNDWLQKKYQTKLVGGKAPRQALIELGKAKPVCLALVFFLTLSSVILPVGAVALSSFLKVSGKIDLSNFTLSNYRYLLFEAQETPRAIFNSFVFASTASATCVSIAFLIAYFKVRSPFRGRNELARLASIPFAIPGTVIALALIISYGGGFGIPGLALLGSPLLILVSYISKYLALSVQSVTPILSTVDPSLDEAARVCGEGPHGVILRVLLPLMLPTLAQVFVLTALPILSEITMSVLLAGPGTETIGQLLFQLQDYANPLAACSLASLLVVLISITMPLLRILSRGVLR